MMRRSIYLVLVVMLSTLSGATLSAHEGVQHIQFVPNKGQWGHPFLYKGVMPNADIYFEPQGIRYLVGAPENNALFSEYKKGLVNEAPALKYHAYTVTWLNANAQPRTVGARPEAHYHNYYLGNDPERWRSNVPIYKAISYKDVYPGTDLNFYTSHSSLKYDIVLAPQARVERIELKYDGLDNISLRKGSLQLRTSVGTIIEQQPYAYQEKDGKKVKVDCDYVLKGSVVSFALPNGYDKTLPLVIDPQIVFASLTGSTADNWGFSATYDNQGNLYAGGIARGAGYPTSVGAVQATYGGGDASATLGTDCDIAISKFNAAGNALLYSTYLGGSSNEMPHSLVVDANNNLIIAGKSASNNYPTKSTSYDPSYNGGFDIVLTKLNADATQLIGSTYVGGPGDDGINMNADFFSQTALKHNYGDDARSEVVVDNAGNIYMAGNTRSAGFPTTPGAMKTSLGGLQDGVFLKFNPNLSTLLYSTFIGGSALDGAYSIALNNAQSHIYITGGTNSTDFHSSSTAGAYQPNNAGGIDGFIMRIQNSGNYPLIRTTYIGTASYDQIYGVQLDNNSGVYIMGQTQGAFPVFPAGVYQNPGSRQFVMKLDSTLATGVFSTVFGSGAVSNVNISPVAFLVDTCENIYISGWGGLTSAGPPTTVNGMPITSTALQATTDGADFYFIVLKKDIQSLLYGSYFGSPNVQEHVDGGTSRFDPNGVVYQAMCASCGIANSFPATPGAYATSDNGANCNLGVVKIAFNLGSVTTDAQALPSTTGCAPFTVDFLDNSFNATSWAWNFGDGNTSNAQTPTHTFANPGVYNVRLIGSNPDACRVLDTSWVTITVTDESISPDFTYTILDSCENLRISLSNTSTGIGGGPPVGASFFWDLGNGNTFSGANPPIQNYPAAGTYDIKLIMSHPDACNTPDSAIKQVTFDPLFVSVGAIPVMDICANATINFNGMASNASTYLWDFGDGNTSTQATPTHAYTQPGSYQVTLIVTNPAACNLSDTLTTTVNIRPAPTVGFTVSPAIAEMNQPFTFTNTSTGATAYKWEFGDGATSSEEHPVHEYKKTGNYQVCLTATNQFNCSAVLCRPVDALVRPLVDVPSGFSPNGDGNNDVFRVRGYGIASMDLKIFNRWGEQIFETTDQDQGWDGTYKGQLQEMDAYAYVLVVEFVDGTKTKRQGNVTLLR